MDDDALARQKQIEELIRGHQVRWEVHPVEAKPLDGERRAVGLEITLAGIFDPELHQGETVRERYDLVSAALREIAEDLVEHAGDPAVRDLDIYDAAVQAASHARPDRAEASLKVSILHPGERPDPLDDTLRDCLAEMETHLKARGAQKGHWREET